MEVLEMRSGEEDVGGETGEEERPGGEWEAGEGDWWEEEGLTVSEDEGGSRFLAGRSV